MEKIRSIYNNNKEIIISLLILLVIYKLLLYIPAFLGYYYNYRLEKFNPQILLNFWNYWDSGWYLSIAKNGYTGVNASFFPLYPLLIKVFSYIFGFRFSAYFINCLALFGALLGLYKLTLFDYGKKDISWRAITYLLIFPTAIFLTAYYNESLFLFLTIWAFYWSRKGNWKYAAFFSFFAGLTRLEGAVIFIYFIFEYLKQGEYKIKNIKKDSLFCLAPLIGLSIYSIYLYFKFGDPFYFLKVIDNWDKKFIYPWESFANYIFVFLNFQIATTPYYLSRVIDLIFMFLDLILGCVVMLSQRLSYGIYVLCSILMVSFTSDLSATNRKSLLLFPILILLAKLGKNPVVNFTILILFSSLFTIFLIRFVNHAWVG